MPEVDQNIKETFSPLVRPAALGCGDDRTLTEESAAWLSSLALPLDKPFVRLFGANHGVANILAITTTAQYGAESAREALGDDFNKIAELVSVRARDQGVIMLAHSAEASEDGHSSLNPSSNKPLGCARLSALGKINHIAASEEPAIEAAKADALGIFGHDGTSVLRELPYAFVQTSSMLFGDDPESYAVSRDSLIETKTSTMILKGNHARSESTFHVINLRNDRVSDVRKALSSGIYYYDSDIVIVAEVLLKSFPELKLNPRTLLEVMLLEAAATRMALAAGDGEADPERIKSRRYGDGPKALEYLYSL